MSYGAAAETNVGAVPDHVPATLVKDFDFFRPEGCEADPHAAWKRVQQESRVFFTPRNGGHWVVTRIAREAT